jgi:hypothetical protein
MEETPLYTFEAAKSLLDSWLVGSVIVGSLGFGLYFLQGKLPVRKNLKNVIGLAAALFGMVAVLSLGLKVFSMSRLKSVKLYRNSIETPYGTAQLREIKDFYIKKETHYKPMQPNVIADSASYLFILERNDKGHVLSEGDYAIDSILGKMNELMGY